MVAILFCFGVMACWGSWPNLRNLSKTEAPVFAILYVGSQWLTTLLAVMTLGNIASDSSSVFDNETFLHELRNRTGSYEKILLVLVSGFLNANGDFLCATALIKLPSSVANPIYGGWVLIQGTLLSFFVEAYGGNLYMLFSGVTFAFFGILAMTASDFYAADPQARLHSRVISVDSKDNNRNGGLYEALAAEKVPILGDEISGDKVGEPLKVVQKWIFVCILAGVVCGAWAPLSVIATTGPGSIDCQYIMMFFFQTGQVSAIPFMIYYYFQFFAPPYDPYSPKIQSRGMGDVLKNLKITAGTDILFGCLTGVAVGTGFFFFFSAVDVIPSTISFAISNCAPLITIFNDVVFCGHLRHATKYQTWYMCLATVLFVVAIVLMVLAESLQ